MKCKICEKELKLLIPPAEDYLEHKFCINIFGWKLMLLKDQIEMGCPECLVDEQQSRDKDNFNQALDYAIASEIEKRNLIPSNELF